MDSVILYLAYDKGPLPSYFMGTNVDIGKKLTLVQIVNNTYI